MRQENFTYKLEIKFVTLIKLLFFFSFIFLITQKTNSKEPSIGYATLGFACKHLEGKATVDYDYVGFFEDQELRLTMMYDQDEAAFMPPFETVPFYFENLQDELFSLSDVYVWYRFFVIDNRVMSIWSHRVFYYDNDLKKYFLADTALQTTKKLEKVAKAQFKVYDTQFKHSSYSEGILIQLQNDFEKINKLYLETTKAKYDAKSIKKYGSVIDTDNLYECEEIY